AGGRGAADAADGRRVVHRRRHRGHTGQGRAVSERSAPPQVLFHEPGASWWWAMLGPASAMSMLLIQRWAGYGVQLLMPGIFLVLVTGFLAIQIKAARIHTSVELTPETLRQGTETIRVDEIVRVFPEPTGS